MFMHMKKVIVGHKGSNCTLHNGRHCRKEHNLLLCRDKSFSIILLMLSFFSFIFTFSQSSAQTKERDFGVPVQMSHTWTVFGPFTEPDTAFKMQELKNIPASLVINGETLYPKTVQAENSRVDFRKVYDSFPVNANALIFIPLTAELAGAASFGFGADWWFEAWIDGQPLTDTIRQGNIGFPPSISNHIASRYLTKGDHLLIVRFIAGTASALITAGGPSELAHLAPSEWAPVKLPAPEQVGPEIVVSGDFETGDGTLPAGWFAGEERFAFGKGELKVTSDAPISGNQSLLVDTTDSRGMRKLILPLSVDPTRIYRIQASAQFLAGEGYLSLAVQSDKDNGYTDYLMCVGSGMRLHQMSSKKGGVELFNGYGRFNEPEMFLVIRAHGAVKVKLDDISIRVVSDSYEFAGHMVQRHPWSSEWIDLNLSGEFESPHTAWAKPLFGGPLHVTGLLPFWNGRMLVEMSQRMPMEHIFIPFDGSTKQMNDWWVRDEDNEPVLLRPRFRSVDILRNEPADAILLWELSASAIDAEQAKLILEKVHAGTGLVITGLKQPYWPLPDGPREEALNHYKSGEWAVALNDTNRLPEDAVKGLLPETQQSEVEFYRYGKGRIAFLKSITIRGVLPESREEFEVLMSGLLKLVLWSAGQNDAPYLAGISMEAGGSAQGRIETTSSDLPSVVDIVLTRPADRDSRLFWWIERTASGGAVTEGSIAVRRGESRIPWQVPSNLPSGVSTLNLQLKYPDGIVDWTSIPVAVAGQNSITGIQIDGLNPFLTSDRPVSGSVRIDKPLADGQRLLLRLEDAEGRLWGETAWQSSAESFVFMFAAPPADILVHRMVAEIDDGSRIVDRKEEEFSIVRPLSFYQRFFDHQLWQIQGDYLSGLAAKQYRSLGITSSYAGVSSRQVALANIRAVPQLSPHDPSRLTVIGDEKHAPENQNPLTHPAYVNRMGQRIAKQFTEGMDSGKWAPLAYCQGHEADMRGVNAPVQADVCFCSNCLESFRKFMQEEYVTLQALNDAWGMDFAEWEDVRPIVLDDAVTSADIEGALSRWINHRRHMDRVYLNYMKAKRDVTRKFVQGIEATHDHFRETNSYSGVDFWLQISELVAGSELGMPALLRSFTPPERRHLMLARNAPSSPFKVTENDELMKLRFGQGRWEHLLAGMHGSAYWAGTPGYHPNSTWSTPIHPDMRPTPLGIWDKNEVNRIREGVDRLVFAGTFDDSGIAILYSRESEHAATVFQKLNSANSLAQSIWPESEAVQIANLLNQAGYQYRRISDAQIQHGALKKEDIRLLILPFSQAISPEAAGAIERFVHSGGRLLADIRPGVLNHRGEPYEEGIFDKIFGIKQDTKWSSFSVSQDSVDIAMPIHGKPVKLRFKSAATVSAVEVSGGTVCGKSLLPTFIVNTYGKGKAVFLNMPVSSLQQQAVHPEIRLPIQVQGENLFAHLLSYMGLKPLFQMQVLDEETGIREDILLGSDDAVVADTEGFRFKGALGYKTPVLYHYRTGEIDILGISSHRQRKGVGMERLQVTWPRKGHVYNLQTGEYLGYQESAMIEKLREGVSVFAVIPYAIQSPELKAKAVKDGTGLTVISAEAVLGTPEGQPHAAQFQLICPEGKPWYDIPDTVLTTDGVARREMVLPLNAPSGTWKVIVKESITRKQAETSVEIK